MTDLRNTPAVRAYAATLPKALRAVYLDAMMGGRGAKRHAIRAFCLTRCRETCDGTCPLQIHRPNQKKSIPNGCKA